MYCKITLYAILWPILSSVKLTALSYKWLHILRLIKLHVGFNLRLPVFILSECAKPINLWRACISPNAIDAIPIGFVKRIKLMSVDPCPCVRIYTKTACILVF